MPHLPVRGHVEAATPQTTSSAHNCAARHRCPRSGSELSARLCSAPPRSNDDRLQRASRFPVMTRSLRQCESNLYAPQAPARNGRSSSGISLNDGSERDPFALTEEKSALRRGVTGFPAAVADDFQARREALAPDHACLKRPHCPPSPPTSLRDPVPREMHTSTGKTPTSSVNRSPLVGNQCSIGRRDVTAPRTVAY